MIYYIYGRGKGFGPARSRRKETLIEKEAKVKAKEAVELVKKAGIQVKENEAGRGFFGTKSLAAEGQAAPRAAPCVPLLWTIAVPSTARR